MLKTMDAKLVQELLSETEDILTPEVEADDAFYKRTRCPMCGRGDCEKRIQAPTVVLSPKGEPVVTRSPFGDSLIPEGYAHCIHCDTNFNPYTGMIYKTQASMIHGLE